MTWAMLGAASGYLTVVLGLLGLWMRAELRRQADKIDRLDEDVQSITKWIMGRAS